MKDGGEVHRMRVKEKGDSGREFGRNPNDFWKVQLTTNR